MSGSEPAYLRSTQSNLEVYSSHNPENFTEALSEFSLYCERQLPIVTTIPFVPTCFDITSTEEIIILGGEHGNIANFDLISNEMLRDEEISPGIPMLSVLLVLDNNQAVALNNSYELFFLEFPSLDILFKVQLSANPTTLKNGSRKQCLYYTNGENALNIVKVSEEEDFYTRKYSRRLFALDHAAMCMESSDDSSLLALGLSNGSVSVMHADTEKILRTTPDYPSAPILISFSEFHHHVAVAYENNVIQVFSLDNALTLKQELVKHTDRVTGLAFVRENKYLVSSSLDTFINVWDMKVESLPYSMNIIENKVTYMKSSAGHKVVFYTQESTSIISWNVPQLPHNARYRGHTEVVSKVLFVPHSFELLSISEDGTAKIWDYRNDTFQESRTFEGKLTNACISKSGHLAMIVSSKPCVYKWNLSTGVIEAHSLRNPVHCISFSEKEKYVAISDPQSRVIVYETDSMEPTSTLKGHTFPVTSCGFIDSDQFLITASQDCTLGKWDISTSGRIGSSFGHDSPILALTVSQEGLIVSSAEEGNIIIWNFDLMLLYTLVATEAGPTISLYLSQDHSFLISLQQQRVTYWQMDNLSLMFQVDTSYPGTSLVVSSDEKFVAVSENHTVYIEENALQSTSIRIVGRNIGSPHRFMRFVIDSQKENSKVPYDMAHNHWVLAPYMLGVTHILSFCNRFADLNRALHYHPSPAGFFASVHEETALSICVEMEYKNCIDICLRYMRSQSQGKFGARNMRAYVPLSNCLAKLNLIEYPYIAKLYDSLFVDAADAYLPTFCLHETELPSLFLSEHMIIYPEELVGRDFFSSTGRPVVFSQSTLPLDLDLGTNGSIEFMTSLLECSDSEIFRSNLVIEYLQFKWKAVKPMVYVLGAIYAFYLILLGLYIPIFLGNIPFLMLLTFVHMVLLAYETLQIATDFTDYWHSIWNILDQLRSITFSFYAIMAFQQEYNTDILLAVLIFSWARGIATFRMFDNTRYMVRMIIQVIVDISTFFVMLFYSTLAFAFVFYLRNPFEQSFPMFLTQAYRLDLGDFETSLTEPFDWFMFFISTLINPLIMLNLLIAIMSDTAAAVAEIDDICGLREMAEMIIDIEKVMFWKKELTHKHFLHKLDFIQTDTSESDKKMEKIKFIKKQVITMKRTVKDIMKSAERFASNEIQNHVNYLKNEQDELKVQMALNFENSKEIIAKIGKKFNVHG